MHTEDLETIHALANRIYLSSLQDDLTVSKPKQMNIHQEIHEWNNPLKDNSSSYWRNGSFTEHSGMYEVVLSRNELMLVVGYMMMGMNKVEKLNKESKPMTQTAYCTKCKQTFNIKEEHPCTIDWVNNFLKENKQ